MTVGMRVVFLALLMWMAAPAWAFVGKGQAVGEWTVTAVERHPEFFRVYFDGPGGPAGLEVVVDEQAAGDWSTGRHRLMPAPDSSPPPALLVAAMEQLRAYDERAGPLLAYQPGTNWPGKVLSEDGGPDVLFSRPPGVPDPTPEGAAEPVEGVPDGVQPDVRHQPAEVRSKGPRKMPWRLIGAVLAGLVVVGGRGWERSRALLDQADALIERFAWPLLGLILAGLTAHFVTGLDIPFDADASTQRIFFGTRDLLDIFDHKYDDQRHPPFFYAVLHMALMFGHSETIVRMPSTLFGVATIGAAFWLARPALGATRAFVVVLFMSVNPSFFDHSREVADITLFMFLLLTSTAFLIRVVRDPEDRVALGGLVVTETAMVWTYYLAPLAALAQLAALAWGGRRLGRAWAAVPAVMLLSWPVLSDLYELLATDTEMRGLSRLFPEHLWGDIDAAQLLGKWAGLMAPTEIAVLLLFGLALVGVTRLGNRPLAIWAGTLLTVSTALMGWAVVMVRLKPYYLLFLLPALLILAVVGALGHPEERAPKPLWLGAVRDGVGFGVVAFLLAVMVPHYLSRADRRPTPYSHRAMFRQIGAIIKDAPDSPKTVIADPNPMHTILLYYAFPQPVEMYDHCTLAGDGSGTRCDMGEYHLITTTALPLMSEGWEERATQRLRDAQQGVETWVLYSEFFPNPAFMAEVEDRCEPKGTWARGISLWRCPPR